MWISNFTNNLLQKQMNENKQTCKLELLKRECGGKSARMTNENVFYCNWNRPCVECATMTNNRRFHYSFFLQLKHRGSALFNDASVVNWNWNSIHQIECEWRIWMNFQNIFCLRFNNPPPLLIYCHSQIWKYILPTFFPHK